ncbi:Got1-like protein [Atractiella rhizophila]|nr:Got1-like protein [Atractiella rhizophila]
MWLTDAQKIGVGLTSFGLLFFFLGVLLSLSLLLALGNILFLGGVVLLIGPQKAVYFFARKQKLCGTLCFVIGIVLVFRRPFVGMCVESIGFLNLFGDFFPIVLSFLRQLPVVGNFLLLPVCRQSPV